MRLHLLLENAGLTPVPFDHLPELVGAVRHCLGANAADFTGADLYSLSWLHGGQGAGGRGITFPAGARWFVSAHHEALIQRLIGKLTRRASFAHGLRVAEARAESTPAFPAGEQRFLSASPVLVYNAAAPGPVEHLRFDDPRADELLTQLLREKLALAGLPSAGATVRFDRVYPRARTKLVTYRGEGVKANVCPVLVAGTGCQIAFAWDVGVGHCTNKGFGALA